MGQRWPGERRWQDVQTHGRTNEISKKGRILASRAQVSLLLVHLKGKYYVCRRSPISRESTEILQQENVLDFLRNFGIDL